MRWCCLLMCLLLLSFLTHEAQGIRLSRRSLPGREQDIHESLSRKGKIDEITELEILCTRKHCSGSIRMLMMTPTSSTTTTNAKNGKNEDNKAHPKREDSSANKKIHKKEENLSVNSSSETDEKQLAPGPFPDILDIAGMDYSQARRKPPIHN